MTDSREPWTPPDGIDPAIRKSYTGTDQNGWHPTDNPPRDLCPECEVDGGDHADGCSRAPVIDQFEYWLKVAGLLIASGTSNSLSKDARETWKETSERFLQWLTKE